MKTLSKFLMAGALALGLNLSASAAGVLISLSPSNQSIVANGFASFDINVSGLKGSADLPGPALGGFDVTLDFNSSIAAVQSVTFGSALNPDGYASPLFDASSPGVLWLEDIATASASALEAAQGSTVKIATISFQGIGAGTTSLAFDLSYPSSTSLSDEWAHDIAFSVSNGSLTVAAVPEPASAAVLLALVGGGFCVIRRRMSRSQQA